MTPLSIEFISDVVCPWCVIGLRGLERALDEVADVARADIRLVPFELNPDMPAGGQDLGEHVREKYGAAAGGDGGATRERIRTMAADLGFEMAQRPGARIYNTFDAHRLLHWAREAGEGRQIALKHALFAAYFTDGRDPGDFAVLVAAAEAAGLDGATARAILAGDDHAEAVRAEEALWRREGVTSVPTVIVDRRYVIQGAQEPAAYARALRRIAAERAAA
jgi:predicted DsbA family dithiol-disulfide isomerase